MSLYPSFTAGGESSLSERVHDVEEQLLGVSESLTRSFSQLKDAILSQGETLSPSYACLCITLEDMLVLSVSET